MPFGPAPRADGYGLGQAGNAGEFVRADIAASLTNSIVVPVAPGLTFPAGSELAARRTMDVFQLEVNLDALAAGSTLVATLYAAGSPSALTATVNIGQDRAVVTVSSPIRIAKETIYGVRITTTAGWTAVLADCKATLYASSVVVPYNAAG